MCRSPAGRWECGLLRPDGAVLGLSDASCNGKPAQAVAIFYKPKVGYTGDDTFVVDVDFHTGEPARSNKVLDTYILIIIFIIIITNEVRVRGHVPNRNEG